MLKYRKLKLIYKNMTDLNQTVISIDVYSRSVLKKNKSKLKKIFNDHCGH